MIGAIRILIRVKRLREEKALAWVRSRQDAVAGAEQLVADAGAAVAENRRGRPAREAAIWDKVLKRVVTLPGIEAAEAEVLELDREHQRLVDRLARTEHTLEQRRRELAEAQAAHRRAMQEIDKYELLREELQTEADAAAAYAEEVELEDLAGRRVARL